MTIITPHADDEALFMGEIVSNASTIILVSDSAGVDNWKQQNPSYGFFRRNLFRSLYRHANIVELNIPDGANSLDLEPYFERVVHVVDSPIVTINPEGHINHAQAHLLGRLLARYLKSSLYVAWAYDDNFKLFQAPLSGDAVTTFATDENLAVKNLLIDKYSTWFRTNFPDKYSPFFDLQKNRHDVISVAEMAGV